MRQLKGKDIKGIREELWEKNDHVCPVLLIEIDKCDLNLDHAHQDSLVSETVSGQIRGSIHKFANSLEGSLRSKYRRSGVARYITFEEFLYNLWNYLMNNREPLLHPQHQPKAKKLMKSSYNELAREIKNCNEHLKKPIKIPVYPKSKRLTKKLGELFEKFAIVPRYYTK